MAVILTSSLSRTFFFREGVGFEDVGSSLDIDSVISVQTTEILSPNDDIPGTIIEISDFCRPSVTPDGQAFVWASAGAGNCNYNLRASSPDYVAEVFLGDGDETSDGTISLVRPFFDVSAAGGNVILSTWADFDKLEVIDSSQDAVIRVNTTRQVGTIIVQKATVPENGGVPEPENFRFEDCTGGGLSLLNSEQQTLQNVDVGACDVTEWAEPGWAPTGLSCDDTDRSGDAETGEGSFNQAAGETVICPYFNILESLPPFLKSGFEANGN